MAPNFLSVLAPSSSGANTVTIASGGAVVDGIVYLNDAPENINIPSASGGGNTRIDRIVLRADWSAFTVRLHRIAGVDAGSPVAPAITQNSGTTYDIQLARVLVDTGGNCTVTDEKVFAAAPVDDVTLEESGGSLRVKAQGIATGNLANDAVDDTKVGNRVPQFYRRQGGNASNWSTPGTTTYTPTTVRMQAGAFLFSPPGVITFPVAFSAVPLVFVSAIGTAGGTKVAWVKSITASTVTVGAQDLDGTFPVVVNWLAIGPE